MNLKARIEAFSQLGNKISTLEESEIKDYSLKAKNENPWFTEDNVRMAFTGIAHMLDEEKLNKWLIPYQMNLEIPKIIGIVMAGNIPLVGCHDLMATLLSGHIAAIKVSKKDTFLVNLLINWLLEIEPDFKKNLFIRERLNDIDAVIATGSDNTSRYFHYYFGKIPNIIRKNRVSVAVLDGSESKEELISLGKDVFSYFGMGCRNVAKVFTPEKYDINELFQSFEEFQYVANNHKYQNNYDYYKSIFLINKTPHLDTGFLIWLDSRELVSPLSTLYSETYEEKIKLMEMLKDEEEKIQCVIGHGFIPFGKSQYPEPWDYADNVDTIKFLSTL